MLQPTALKIFIFGAIGLSIGAASWLSGAPAAATQVDTADPVCYLYGSDGQQYDLSALCGTSDTERQQNQTRAAIGAEPEAGSKPADSEPVDTADVPQPTLTEAPPLLEEILPRLENATRLLSPPEPAGS